ncbi:glycosyl hydrolase family 28-related protein [Paenibacillus oryzisoli]|uniref:glycosyl hydrolase family 28-related protein n=1 Tax=Paenibacillus oryzisoli TaxID=1850517 RepID=UPI003D2CC0F3
MFKLDYKHIRYLLLVIAILLVLFLIYKYFHPTPTILNVKDFGAKGDGISDDTRSIQTALDAGTKKKLSIYFPAGTYIVNANDTLMIKSNTRMVGDGLNSVIKADKSKFAWSLFYISGSNIQINQIQFDGNNTVNRVVVIQPGSSKVQISNSLVSNASQSDDKSSDFYSSIVAGILIYGNTYSIAIDQTEIQNVVSLHQLDGSLIARGIYITTTPGASEKSSTNLSIQNTTIHDIGPADDGDGIYYEDPLLNKNIIQNTNSTIKNNTFYNCAKRAIKLYANGIEVTGNHILNNYLNNNYYQGKDKGKLAPDMYAGISVYGNNIKVANNVLEGRGSFYSGIEITSSQTVRNIEVSANTITMGTQSKKIGTTSIRVGNIEDFSISSNILENGERGIWNWQNATRGTITENIIHMPDGGGIDLTTYLPNFIQNNIRCSNNNITAKTFAIRTPEGNSSIYLNS